MSALKRIPWGRSVWKFQNELYKSKNRFNELLESLPERINRKTTYVKKVEEAIENELPTVALAIANEVAKLNEPLGDMSLRNCESLCQAPTNAIFLKKAFGNGQGISELPEKLVFLTETNTPTETLRYEIISKLGGVHETKFSDYLGVCLLMNSQKYFDIEVATQLDQFNGTSIFEYLYEFTYNLEETSEVSSTFRQDVLERFKYFGEGIKKWAFIDRNTDLTTKNYIRELLSMDRREKKLTIEETLASRSLEQLTEDVKVLHNYIGTSSYFYTLLNANYKCEVGF